MIDAKKKKGYEKTESRMLRVWSGKDLGKLRQAKARQSKSKRKADT
jgi:hypothetical protein